MTTAAPLPRLVLMLLRPPVAAVILLFAAIGAARAGEPDGLHPLFTSVTVILGGWFVHAAALNDLADEAIDRVNLAGARGRPLVRGVATRRRLGAVAVGAAALSLGAAALEGWPVMGVVAVGLGLNAAYSLRPVRLSDRGAVASAILPAGYFAVPYLVGALAVEGALGWHELALLPGLYVAFMGRIVLKDFRDTAGDALYGKWTFLLRHGRHATCLLSGACWVVGAVAVLAALPRSPALVLAVVAMLACALHALGRLADDGGPVADQVAIGAVAMAGRGLCVATLAHLTMAHHDWSAAGTTAVLLGLTVVFVEQCTATLAARPTLAAVRPW